MSEKRSELRKRLSYYVNIRNRLDNALVGRVIDITPGGIRVFSEAPVKTIGPMHLMMELPQEIDGSNFLMFDANPVWNSQELNDEFPEFYDTGLKMINLSLRNQTMIEVLIEEYGSQAAN